MQQTILLGTYTRRKSQGIYQIQLDTTAKALTNLELLVPETSPTYLAKSQAGNLYSVTTVDGKGGCSAYDANQHFLNAVTEEGAPLCYVAVDEERQLVYGANYHKGEVNVYRIEDDGSLTATDQVFHDEPCGSNENQDKPHVHYTDLTPDKRLAVCDLGTDRVYTYDISAEGKLTEVAVYVAEDGTGPRHLAFHPNGEIAYLFGELDSTVTVLRYDATTGSFSQLQKLSTLPEGFTGANGGAAIRVTQDGRFLYASNRGHNSVVVFAITKEGTYLTSEQWISTEGDFPRDFHLAGEEAFVVCANQNSDNLTLYARDAESGHLALLEKDVFAPEAVCVYPL